MTNIVFIHGWGMNSAVWQPMLGEVEAQFQKGSRPFQLHCLDLPGYGANAGQTSSSDLIELAQYCLDNAPDQAVWVGWSLGGMVAMQAALLDQGIVDQGIVDQEKLDEKRVDQQSTSKRRIKGLQLLNTTPCFVQKNDWPHGVDMAVFDKFCARLSADYQAGLKSFLLLQAGGQAGAKQGARALVTQAMSLLERYPAPSPVTLQAGLTCLANVDLRARLLELQLPVHIASGQLDRITHPDASNYLAQHIIDAEHTSLPAGHAPVLTHASLLAEKLTELVESLQIREVCNG